MSREAYIFAILAFGIINGIFSPIMIAIAQPLTIVIGSGFMLLGFPKLLLFLNSLIASTLVIMLGGVPAALFERATRRRTSDVASMWIWLAGVALISLPALGNVIAAMR